MDENGMHLQDRPVDCTYMCIYIYKYIYIHICFLREKHAHFVFTTSLLSLHCTFSAAFSLAFSALRNFSCSFFCAACASSSLEEAHGCNIRWIKFGLGKKAASCLSPVFLVGKPSFERPKKIKNNKKNTKSAQIIWKKKTWNFNAQGLSP